jgi:hypothetical protein
VLLRGKIVKVEWVNPHSWIHVEVVKPDGKKEIWMVEGGSPNSLFRRGVTRDSLQIGTEIIVDGYQARDYTSFRANGRNITFVDGKKLFLGSSGTGALATPDRPRRSGPCSLEKAYRTCWRRGCGAWDWRAWRGPGAVSGRRSASTGEQLCDGSRGSAGPISRAT